MPYLPRQILANAQEMEVEAVVEDHAGIFGRLTAVPAGQGGVRSAGEILSAMVNQTRRENLSASVSSGRIPVPPGNWTRDRA